VTVTDVPAGPEVGDRLLITGVVEGIVKATPLLATPLTVTTTLPVVAFSGTGTLILEPDQLVGEPATPLKVTVLVPWLDPNLDPEMVTDVPAAPDAGDRLEMLGASMTVKLTPVLATPPTVTTTLPVLAPEGTGVWIDVALQLVGVAVTPLNVTVLPPCVAPKFVPDIVTTVPTAPEVGDRLEIVGLGATVKLTPLLAIPPTITTTFPVVAPAGTGVLIVPAAQLVGVATVPLNFTVLEP